MPPACQAGQQSMLDSVIATDRKNINKTDQNNTGHFLCWYQIYTDPWLVRRGIDIGRRNRVSAIFSRAAHHKCYFNVFLNCDNAAYLNALSSNEVQLNIQTFIICNNTVGFNHGKQILIKNMARCVGHCFTSLTQKLDFVFSHKTSAYCYNMIVCLSYHQITQPLFIVCPSDLLSGGQRQVLYRAAAK